MEPKRSPTYTQNRGFSRKVPKVVWTYYLLYILYIGTLRKPHFLTPRSKQNAGLFRMVPRMPPRSCKMTPTGPKNGESRLSRSSQGCQRVPPMPPKMLQKIIEKSAPLSRTASKGAFGVPRGAHRPQNASIFEVPLSGIILRRRKLHLSFPSLLHLTHFLLSLDNLSLGTSASEL